MNIVALVGRLTADPELRNTPNGHDVCSFTIAVDRGFASADGERKADFINCIAWRNTALFITRYFKKGQFIGVTGSIQTRTYQDKETGKNRTAFEVVANTACFTEGKAKASPDIEKTVAFPTAELDDFSSIGSDDGDLPF